jgi:hypothetical protein
LSIFIAKSRSRKRDDGPLVADLLYTCRRRRRRSQCLEVVVVGWSLKQTGIIGVVVVVVVVVVVGYFVSTMLHAKW